MVFSLGSGPVTIITSIGPPPTGTTPTLSAILSTGSSMLSSSLQFAPSGNSPSSTTTISSPSSTASTPPGSSPSSTTTVISHSSTARPSSNHVDVAIGIGVGLPVGLALLAGLVYTIRRRSATSDRRDGNQAYRDDNQNLDGSRNVVHKTPELMAVSRPFEVSEQGLVELRHPQIHPAVEID